MNCVSCGANLPEHHERCATLPLMCHLTDSELWQLYHRMDWVERESINSDAAKEAGSIKTDILREVKRRKLIYHV